MTPLILHLLFLGLLSLPAVVTGFFYLHYRFFLKDELKASISEKSRVSVVRVHKKGKVFEDGDTVPPKEAMGILFLVFFATMGVFWLIHVSITSLSFYFVSSSYLGVLLVHLLSLFGLVVFHIARRKKS
jgi:hypothetical protein